MGYPDAMSTPNGAVAVEALGEHFVVFVDSKPVSRHTTREAADKAAAIHETARACREWGYSRPRSEGGKASR